jgi:hypothetical protein
MARRVAWYFGIGSAAEAERRPLERDDEDEDRPWWRGAIAGVGGAVAFEVVRAVAGLAGVIADEAVPLAIFVAVSLVVSVWVRARRDERPPVD